VLHLASVENSSVSPLGLMLCTYANKHEIVILLPRGIAIVSRSSVCPSVCEGKGPVLDIVLLHDEHMPRSALRSRK